MMTLCRVDSIMNADCSLLHRHVHSHINRFSKFYDSASKTPSKPDCIEVTYILQAMKDTVGPLLFSGAIGLELTTLVKPITQVTRRGRSRLARSLLCIGGFFMEVHLICPLNCFLEVC